MCSVFYLTFYSVLISFGKANDDASNANWVNKMKQIKSKKTFFLLHSTTIHCMNEQLNEVALTIAQISFRRFS